MVAGTLRMGPTRPCITGGLEGGAKSVVPPLRFRLAMTMSLGDKSDPGSQILRARCWPPLPYVGVRRTY